MEKTEKLKTQEEKLAALEAILFAYGEPITLLKLASIIGISAQDIEALVEKFSQLLEQQERGLVVVKHKDCLTLATKPQFSFLLEEFIKEDLKEDLTSAASETLALIAYFGPITRSHIDFVRGVNSSFMLRNLLMRGLIERKAGKGNAYEYETSVDFLKHMGVKSAEELPEYEKYKQLKEKYFGEEALASLPDQQPLS